MVLERALLHNPDNPSLLYRQAAYEFLLGQKKHGLTSLQNALLSDASKYREFLDYDPRLQDIQDAVDLISEFLNP